MDQQRIRRRNFIIHMCHGGAGVLLAGLLCLLAYSYEDSENPWWYFLGLALIGSVGLVWAGVSWWRIERPLRELEELLEADLSDDSPEPLLRPYRDLGELVGGLLFLGAIAAIIVIIKVALFS